MRVISGILCGLMILFAAVQYNDPDGIYWAIIYAVPAVFCGLRAFRPELVKSVWGFRLLSAALILAAFGVAWFWPQTPGFWHQEVWWVTEEAREGMGMMIAFIALLIVWFGTRRQRPTIRI
ncbi:Transmembrane family 220, helix [Sulfitobacter brevis]|uniref:Transmembrane family 220, helix n=1 Tax=Sulfitobacter brevis TaxID=74348 RepID=A0A1I2GLL1_9RHOB|nr:transmembrane 220 family protein [Sulfitobacter brevis]SFF18103.1 Transmembrane family 220, helix [Sulfitobacter brevis]